MTVTRTYTQTVNKKLADGSIKQYTYTRKYTCKTDSIKPKFDKEAKNDIVYLHYSKLLTMQKIAKLNKSSVKTISKIIKFQDKLDKYRPTLKRDEPLMNHFKNKNLPREFIPYMRSMYDLGYSKQCIARTHNTSLYRTYKVLGLQRKKTTFSSIQPKIVYPDWLN